MPDLQFYYNFSSLQKTFLDYMDFVKRNIYIPLMETQLRERSLPRYSFNGTWTSELGYLGYLKTICY